LCVHQHLTAASGNGGFGIKWNLSFKFILSFSNELLGWASKLAAKAQSRGPLPASDENALVSIASEEKYRTFVQGKQRVLKYF
jgi:hypothetical protein